jgi:hypothetical protein
MEDPESTTSEVADVASPTSPQVAEKKETKKKRQRKIGDVEFAIPAVAARAMKRKGGKSSSKHFKGMLRLGKLVPVASVFPRTKHAKKILRATGKRSEPGAVDALRYAVFEYNAFLGRDAIGHLNGLKRLSDTHLKAAIRANPEFFSRVHGNSAFTNIGTLKDSLAQIPLTTSGKYTPDVVKKLLKKIK